MATLAYDLRDAVLTLLDGAGTPNTLAIKFDEGNLTHSRKRNIEYKKDRGVLDHTREGEDEPLELNWEGRFHAITSSSGDPVTPTEFLEQQGAASGYISVGDLCEPYAVDVQLKFTPACGSPAIENEIITFGEFRFEEISGDFKAGTMGVSGKCAIVKPTAVRTTT